MSASRMFNAPEMSRTALDERSVGVASGAALRAFSFCLSMSLLQILGLARTPIPLSLAQLRLKAMRSSLTSFLCVVHRPWPRRSWAIQRPAVAEDDGPPFAPVVVIGPRFGFQG